MKYLLDTCVVSELIRPKPDQKVVNWVSAQEEENLFLSTITLGEIKNGIEKLPDSPKRTGLEEWLEKLEHRFSSRLIGIHIDEAYSWGVLSANAAKKGYALPVADGLIAACAQVHALTIVTRNTIDFISTGVPVMNPWNNSKT